MTTKQTHSLALLFAVGCYIFANSATITVTNDADTGNATLRGGILLANFYAGHDTIEFNIPGSMATIDLETDLPAITDPLTIDGSSQPGYVSNPS